MEKSSQMIQSRPIEENESCAQLSSLARRSANVRSGLQMRHTESRARKEAEATGGGRLASMSPERSVELTNRTFGCSPIGANDPVFSNECPCDSSQVGAATAPLHRQPDSLGS